MPFIKFKPAANVDGWTAYQVSFDLGLIIKSKPGKTQIESFPRPFLLESADEPDVVADLILADLAEDEGGAEVADEVTVTDEMVHEAMAVWDSARPFTKARDVMRVALTAALKARRP